MIISLAKTMFQCLRETRRTFPLFQLYGLTEMASHLASKDAGR